MAIGDYEPAPLYKGEHNKDKAPLALEDGSIIQPIKFITVRPSDEEGKERDQKTQAAEHMHYSATLGLPELGCKPTPRRGRAVIVGGAPSIKNHLKAIRKLSKDENNCIFAINWTHTWLLQNGVVPDATVFFEIDAEPETVLKNAHKDVTYFICSHCHKKTFDDLKEFNRVLWHTPPNSEIEAETSKELFPGANYIGGGISSFTRTITVALHMGYRDFDLFGCDSSFPDDKTHVDGYETIMDAKTDTIEIHAKAEGSNETRKFKTLGYLALQVEEFKLYCEKNHGMFSLQVHGDSLLQFVHKTTYPDQYVGYTRIEHV